MNNSYELDSCKQKEKFDANYTSEQVCQMVVSCKNIDFKTTLRGKEYYASKFKESIQEYVVGYGNTMWEAVKQVHELCKD